jgi:TonB family protein
VQTDGSVANLEVLNTTSPRLNAAALEAIGQWRFQPVSRVQTGAVEVGFNLE